MKRSGLKRISGLLLATAVSLGGMSTASAQGTIKIALIEGLSGPMANAGDLALKHLRYKAEEINKQGGVLGKKIEIIAFDNKTSPQESLSILRQVADQGIQYITQGNGSHVAAALIDGIEKHNQRNPNKILYLNYAAVDPALTEERCSFWHFRVDAHSEIKLEVYTEYLAKSPDVKKVFLINQDYSHGHQIQRITRRLLNQKNPNIEVVGDILHPIGRVKDFSPYISQIRASGADSVITGNWGNDLSLLVKAADDANLNAKFYTYYGGGLGTPSALAAAGEGRLFQVTEYHRNLPLEMDATGFYDFVMPYDEKYPTDNWYYHRIGTQLDLLKQAMEAAKSIDPTKVAFALEDLQLETPFGPAVMRGIDHQLLQPMFVSVFTKDAKYDTDGTGLGWKTIASFSAADASTPTSCQMKRPKR